MTTTQTHDHTLEKARLANEAGFFVSVTQNASGYELSRLAF